MAGPVLFCAATLRELETAVPGDGPRGGNRHFAVTGVGIPLTLARLIPLIADLRPTLIVNFGIAGAYPGSGLAVGDVVAGESEAFGDLGMETPEEGVFLPLAGMPWADPEYRTPFALVPPPWKAAAGLKRGRGCTVNSCAGTAATGALRRRLFGVDFESMEGAAVALAASRAGIPVAEVRSISNIASDRDMRPEYVAKAMEALGAALRAGLELP
jgi:futalosine hydrolase